MLLHEKSGGSLTPRRADRLLTLVSLDATSLAETQSPFWNLSVSEVYSCFTRSIVYHVVYLHHAVILKLRPAARPPPPVLDLRAVHR